jgi:hypothetical protein
MVTPFLIHEPMGFFQFNSLLFFEFAGAGMGRKKGKKHKKTA